MVRSSIFSGFHPAAVVDTARTTLAAVLAMLLARVFLKVSLGVAVALVVTTLWPLKQT